MRLLAFVLLLCSATAGAQTSKNSTAGKDGRFQLIQLGDMRRDQMLLDTQTGRVWGRTCLVASSDAAGCEMYGWMLNEVESVTASKEAIYNKAFKLEDLMKAQTPAPASESKK